MKERGGVFVVSAHLLKLHSRICLNVSGSLPLSCLGNGGCGGRFLWLLINAHHPPPPFFFYPSIQITPSNLWAFFFVFFVSIPHVLSVNSVDLGFFCDWRCCRSDWPGLFILLLSTLVCCQPTELIWGCFFFFS